LEDCVRSYRVVQEKKRVRVQHLISQHEEYLAEMREPFNSMEIFRVNEKKTRRMSLTSIRINFERIISKNRARSTLR